MNQLNTIAFWSLLLRSRNESPFESLTAVFTRVWRNYTLSTCTTTCWSGSPGACLGGPRPWCYSTTWSRRSAATTWPCSTPWPSSTSATTSWPVPGCTVKPSGSCACWRAWTCQETAFTCSPRVFPAACSSSRSRTTSWPPYPMGHWRACQSFRSLSSVIISWNWIQSTREPGWSSVHLQWVGQCWVVWVETN